MSGLTRSQGDEKTDEEVLSMPLVYATPVLRTEAGFIPAGPDGRPDPNAPTIAASEPPVIAQNPRRRNLRVPPLGERNCCENRACLGVFWAIIAGFLIASLAIGLATKRPWLGALGMLSIIPAVVILYFLYWKDHQTQVALPRVVNMFTWGVVGAIPCAFLELLLTFLFGWATGYNTKDMETEHGRGEPISHVVLYSLFAAFFVAALCEESLKYYLVVEFPNGTKSVRTAYGIIVCATSGALGFATLENIGYVFQDGSSASFAVAIMRALLAVPLHAATGLIIGINIAQALMNRTSPVSWRVLWFPILIHGTYDGMLMLTIGLGDRDPEIKYLGLASLAIPLLALIYAVRRVYLLPPEYYTDESRTSLLR